MKLVSTMSVIVVSLRALGDVWDEGGAKQLRGEEEVVGERRKGEGGETHRVLSRNTRWVSPLSPVLSALQLWSSGQHIHPRDP